MSTEHPTTPVPLVDRAELQFWGHDCAVQVWLDHETGSDRLLIKFYEHCDTFAGVSALKTLDMEMLVDVLKEWEFKRTRGGQAEQTVDGEVD